MPEASAPPVPYFGGKQRIAAQIVKVLPDHRHYVEPFCGSLAVLFAKPPVPFETVNDLDGHLVTFWRVLRDRGEEFMEQCVLTPHSHAEHQSAYDLSGSLDEMEVARRVWVLLTQGRGATRRRTGWRHFQNPVAGKSMPDHLAAYVARMAPAIERLHQVSLECRPALEVIADYGRHSGVCLYVDPPYLGDTRTSRSYAVEMTDDSAHEELGAALRAASSAVVVSGYPSDLYEEIYRDWRRVEIETFTSQANRSAVAAEKRTEVLWCNRPDDTGRYLDGF